MAGYIEVSIDSDPETLVQGALLELTQQIPGFVAKEAHLEVWLLEVAARLNAETLYAASTVPDLIFRYFGESLMGVPPIEARSAETLSHWLMIDNAGYTIPAGTVVAFQLTGDRLVPFVTMDTVVVAPGSIEALAVRLKAVQQGTLSNGIGPAGLMLVDSLAYVLSLEATQVTSGGVDQETDKSYMGRLSDELRILSPRFVLARDAAVLARRISGAYRAIAIDNYNTVDSTYGNPRMITVAVVDAAGLPVPTDVKNEVQAYLLSLREINFIINVTNPTYTPISVVFAVVADPNYSLDDVSFRTADAIRAYLNPAVWGGGDQTPPVWRASSNRVRYLEVSQVINEVPGVDYITTLLVNGDSVNVTLSGVAPLPSVGTVAGSAAYV